MDRSMSRMMGARGRMHGWGSDSLTLVAIDSEPVGGEQVSTTKSMHIRKKRMGQWRMAAAHHVSCGSM